MPSFGGGIPVALKFSRRSPGLGFVQVGFAGLHFGRSRRHLSTPLLAFVLRAMLAPKRGKVRDRQPPIFITFITKIVRPKTVLGIVRRTLSR